MSLLCIDPKHLTRHARTYAEAKARCAAFAPYATAGELFTAVLPSSPLDHASRDPLLLALVAENQRAPHPLWQSLLVAAFERTLVRLRKKLGAYRDEDHDQRILLAFLEALRTVAIGAHTPLAIRWAVEDAVSGYWRAVRLEAEVVCDGESETHGAAGGALGADAETKTSATEILRFLDARGQDEMLRVLLATEAGDESLKEYVARTHASDASAYERLARERLVVLQTIRARLAPAARAA
jgi:hypothetical protein